MHSQYAIAASGAAADRPRRSGRRAAVALAPRRRKGTTRPHALRIHVPREPRRAARAVDAHERRRRGRAAAVRGGATLEGASTSFELASTSFERWLRSASSGVGDRSCDWRACRARAWVQGEGEGEGEGGGRAGAGARARARARERARAGARARARARLRVRVSVRVSVTCRRATASWRRWAAAAAAAGVQAALWWRHSGPPRTER